MKVTFVRNITYLFTVFFTLMSYFIFLKSFFPIKKAIPGYATTEDFPNIPLTISNPKVEITIEHITILKPVYGRLVLILIDAFRSDFITNPDTPMSYTKHLINKGSALTYIAKVHPPTVTLPRIKALTTGGIPGFVDIILNVDSSALQEDNLLAQLKSDGKRMLFYGDDTWLRLFPDHFQRHDGTTSFFVNDYTQVDSNVTRHLATELKNLDWDVMILHYLGLDHIGHLAGPYSPLVKPKLEEMDSIIEFIHTQLIQQLEELPTLLVICGDHGMSDQGSHGGATESETSIPIIFLSSQPAQYKGIDSFVASVQQIDLTSTLAVLLGVPIPQNNLGKIISSALIGYSIDEKVKAMQYNAHQLLQVLERNVADIELESGFHDYREAVRRHADWLSDLKSNMSATSWKQYGDKLISHYDRAIHAMNDKIVSSLSRYDVHGMVIGLIGLWTTLFAIILCSIQWSNNTAVVIKSFELWLLLVGGCICAFHVAACSHKDASEVFCNSSNMASIFLQLVFIGIVTVTTVIIIHMFFSLYGNNIKIFKMEVSSKYLALGIVVHTVSLLSSSFVEEEHQTWYFFLVTAYLVIFVKLVSQKLATLNYTCKSEGQLKSVSNLQYNLIKACAEDEYDHDDEKNLINQKNDHILSDSQRETARYHSIVKNCDRISHELDYVDRGHHKMVVSNSWQPIFGAMILLLLCRILRVWNQTGNKWLDTPDIGDWLIRPENVPYLSGICLMSLIIVAALRWNCHSLYENILLWGGLVAVYAFRSATGSIILSPLGQNMSKGVLEARLVYIACGLLLVSKTITNQIQQRWRGSIWKSFIFMQSLICPSKEKENKHPSYKKLSSFDSDSRPSTNGETIVHHFPFLLSFITDDNSISAWILLILLLLRSHNMALVAMMVLQEHVLSHWVCPSLKLSATSQTLLYMWAMQAAFFYQGNSNSMSTIDVAAGYAGLHDHQPALTGLLMSAATAGCFIFWMLSLIKDMHSKHRCNTKWCLDLCATVILSRLLLLSVYTILVTFERYHLFVWTVFSPKLLYEAFSTVVTYFIVLILLFCNILYKD